MPSAISSTCVSIRSAPPSGTGLGISLGAVANTAKLRKFWGWGYEGEGPSRGQQEQMAKTLAGMFDLDEIAVADPPKIEELELPEPRRPPPAPLEPLWR